MTFHELSRDMMSFSLRLLTTLLIQEGIASSYLE